MEPVDTTETPEVEEPIPSPEPTLMPGSEELAEEIRALEAEEAQEAEYPKENNLSALPPTEHYAIFPLYDRVLVRRDEAPETLRGIVVADTHKQKPQRGTVIAVGQGRILAGHDHYVAPVVSPGQRVLFGMYSGVEVELDSDGRETALILREDEIIAVVQVMGEGAIPMPEGGGNVVEGQFGEEARDESDPGLPPEPAE